MDFSIILMLLKPRSLPADRLTEFFQAACIPFSLSTVHLRQGKHNKLNIGVMYLTRQLTGRFR